MDDTTKEISKLLRLAIKAEEANDIEQARQLYLRCLELDDGTDSDAHYPRERPVRLRASVLHVIFLRNHDNAKEALTIATRGAERWPDDGMAHLQLGECLATVGRPSEAEQAYRRSLAIEPMSWTWSLLSKLLNDAFEGRESEALECLRAALALDPNDDEAHYNVGWHLRLRGDLEGAIEHLSRALAIDPAYAEAHAELGFALCLQSRDAGPRRNELLRTGIEHLERSIDLNPSYAWSRLYLAAALWNVQRLRQARQLYHAAIELEAKEGIFHGLYADFVSSAFGPSAEAERRFRKAVELDPENGQIHYLFGKHLHRAGRHAEAQSELLLADRLGEERALAFLKSADD